MTNKIRGGVIDTGAPASAPPTTGTHAAGEVVFNNTGSSPVGWRCTTSGTPGTWEAFGSSSITATFTFDPPAITAAASGGSTPTEDVFVDPWQKEVEEATRNLTHNLYNKLIN